MTYVRRTFTTEIKQCDKPGKYIGMSATLSEFVYFHAVLNPAVLMARTRHCSRMSIAGGNRSFSW